MLALLTLGGLYLVFLVYVSGQTVVATVGLIVVALMVYVYLAPGAYSYRYLFPGVAGAIIFVVFPMLYTIAIGFTNYSSKNLLEFDRATKYLLEETYQTEGQVFASSLHRDGREYRLKLENQDVGLSFVTGPLALKKAERVVIQATPAQSSEIALGEAVELREIIPLRNMLKEVVIHLPDGSELTMSGLREFAPVRKLYSKNPDGTLTNVQTNQIIKPNFKTGFYETAQGEQLAPGFKVGIGFDNFRRVLGDESIQQPSLRIFAWNVTFSFMSVLLTAAVGMFLAVLLNWEAIAGRGVYRTLLFLPYAVPGFISILVFKGLFNNNFGEINLILNQIIGVKPPWFSDPTLAKVMILIVNTWLGYPYMMVLCQGLIKSIPSDLYEASALAGAGPLTNFFKITMPLILKPLMPLLISSFAFNFNNFVLISLLTNGRPDFLDTKIPAGETDILVSYTYRIAFGDSGQQFGLAAAISTVIFIMVAILSILNLKLTKVNQQEAR
nr:maltose ABC transporter permease MalF [Niveibacterium umoris]